MEEGGNLYHYKGVIAVKGVTETFIFRGVSMSFLEDFDDNFIRKEDKARESRFIFIGKTTRSRPFNQEGFQKRIALKVGNTVLRFPVGTVVDTNVGVYRSKSETRTMPTVLNLMGHRRLLSGGTH